MKTVNLKDLHHFVQNKGGNIMAIVIGYQGVGKSTMCRKHNDCIDLESSSFGLKMKIIILRDGRTGLIYMAI